MIHWVLCGDESHFLSDRLINPGTTLHAVFQNVGPSTTSALTSTCPSPAGGGVTSYRQCKGCTSASTPFQMIASVPM